MAQKKHYFSIILTPIIIILSTTYSSKCKAINSGSVSLTFSWLSMCTDFLKATKSHYFHLHKYTSALAD